MGYGENNVIEWTIPIKNSKLWPPPYTKIVVVDTALPGAVKVFEMPLDNYMGRVRIEMRGWYIMVPWKSVWWFYAIGDVRLAYITAQIEGQQVVL